MQPTSITGAASTCNLGRVGLADYSDFAWIGGKSCQGRGNRTVEKPLSMKLAKFVATNVVLLRKGDVTFRSEALVIWRLSLTSKSCFLHLNAELTFFNSPATVDQRGVAVQHKCQGK